MSTYSYKDTNDRYKKKFLKEQEELALKYLKKGFSVIPLNYKIPLIEWTEFQKRHPTEEEIKGWFAKDWEITGIGIVTGKISNIIVIDIEADEDSGTFIEKYKIPETLVVSTGGGGLHFYFKYDEKSKLKTANMRKIGISGDIRSDGGMVVAPISFHEKGYDVSKTYPARQYQYYWCEDAELDNEILEMSEQLTDKLAELYIQTEIDWGSAIKGVSEGNRNEFATKITGNLLHYLPTNKWENTVWPLIQVWNKNNKPPLDEKELRTTYKSIAKKELAKKTIANPTHKGEIKICSLKELLDMPVEKESFLIDKYVPMGITALSGHPQSGKSWIMLEIAKSVAKGEKLFEKYEAQQGNVLIVDEESGKNELIRRTKLMGLDKDLPIYFSHMAGIKIDQEQVQKSLLKITEELDIKLIIFDPFTSIHSKTENSAEEMQKVMDAFQLFTSRGIGVIFIHHHRKDAIGENRSAAQGLRGSSVLLSRPDSVIVTKKESESDAFEEIIMSQLKLRTGKKEKPVVLFLEEHENGIVIKFGGSTKAEENKLTDTINFISTILEENKLSTSEIIKLVKEKISASEKTTRNALKSLRKSGKVEKCGKTGKEFVFCLSSPNE